MIWMSSEVCDGTDVSTYATVEECDVSRADELAITICIVHLDAARENPTESQLEELNVRISKTLNVELRNYTRSVDDALTLIPDGWGGEITWERTTKHASVVLSAPNPVDPTTMDKLGSHALVQGLKVHFPLPIAICLSALKVHLLIRETSKRKAAH
jgi:hypothetical protein